MATNANATDASIEPPTDARDVALPDAVSKPLGTMLGAEDPPSDVGEWMDAHDGALIAAMGPPTVEDLCTLDDGRHAFTSLDGEQQRYVCVLDPLAYPYITGTPGTIESTTPLREEAIEVTVTGEAVTTDHEDAVVSIGVSNDVQDVDEITPEVVYSEICSYIHAFADHEEYQTWAADVDGETTSVPLETGVGIAGVIAQDLFGATADGALPDVGE